MAEFPPVKDRKKVIRRTMKALSAMVEALSKLERDPPVVEIAELERTGSYSIADLREPGNDVLRLAGSVNEYRRRYWVLENTIRQAFLSILRSRGYLPASSREVESLKSSLPNSLIKGDDRVWKYSFDTYMVTISGQVGRSVEGAPSSEDVWSQLEAKFSRSIDGLVATANKLIPELIKTRSKLSSLLSHTDIGWKEIRVRAPKVTPVSRPIRPIIIIKRPIPLGRRPRRPRKKLIGGPKREVIGPKGVVD